MTLPPDQCTSKLKVCTSVVLVYMLFCVGFVHAQPIVNRVEIRGLDKTKSDYLEPFIQTEVGQTLSMDEVDSDMQTLRNLQIFSSVDSEVITEEDRAIVLFDVTERVTRIPITNFGGITDNFWFQVGINEYNWLGRGGYFGGFYQFYDRHTFKIFQQLPYLFGQRWGLSYVLGRQATREPAYFQSGTSEFDVDRWEITTAARFEVFRNLDRHESLVWEFGGGYLNETYDQRPGASFVYDGETRFDKYFLQTSISYERLKYFYHYLSGIAPTIVFERVQTIGMDDSFWKVLGQMRVFRRVGKRGNPAMRMRLGISSNDDSPFVPFVLDSYLNVRGSGNRVARGTSEFTVNLEYRHTLIDRKKWAVQGVVFIDNSSWRQAGTPLFDMFLKENTVSFGGGGTRFYLQKIYSFTLRLDYGVNLNDASSKGFVLGVGQYF